MFSYTTAITDPMNSNLVPILGQEGPEQCPISGDHCSNCGKPTTEEEYDEREGYSECCNKRISTGLGSDCNH